MAHYFSSNLRFLRESKKMTRTELAKLLNVHQSTISRWENNEMGATIDNAIDVSEALDIPLPELLGVDLRLNQDIKKTIFNKDGVEITIATDGDINDKMLLEINNLLLNEKILKEELKKSDARNAEK